MQDISKNVIRHRTAEVWQNSGCSSRCALHRALCPGYPRISRIEAAGVEMAALARLDFDLRKTLALKMTFKRGNNFIYLRADDVTKLAIGTRHARNGVDRPLRCACVKGQDLKRRSAVAITMNASLRRYLPFRSWQPVFINVG